MSYFYAIQLAPDIAPQRVKLGITTNPRRRLLEHRTAAPTAAMLALWPCSRKNETVAIEALTRGAPRVGVEVYDIENPNSLVTLGCEHFGIPCEKDLPTVIPNKVRRSDRLKESARYREATDWLARNITLDDLAAALGVSAQSVKQARLDPDATGHRSPPPGWPAAIIRLADSRMDELRDLRDTLAGDYAPHLADAYDPE